MQNEVNNSTEQLDNLKTLEDLASAESLEKTITVTRKFTVIGTDNKPSIGTKEDHVFVRPLVVSKWAYALKHFRNIIAALPDAIPDLSDEITLALFIAQIIGEAHEEVLAVSALAIDRPVSFFDEIELDAGIKIFSAVFEVNKDFFTRTLMPMLKKLAPEISEKMNAVAAQVGQTT